MKTVKVAIICPTHKSKLADKEIRNLRITGLTNADVDKYFLVPESVSLKFFKDEFPQWNIVKVKAKYFRNELTYNRFMLSSKIYKLFSNYSFILICQSDAILVNNIKALPFEYDYIGAPWKNGCKFLKINLFVGNGGLSLRRVSRFYKLTSFLFFLRFFKGNEDVLFSFMGALRLLSIPNVDVAKNIFVESYSDDVENFLDYTGFHALHVFNKLLEDRIYSHFENSLKNEF